MSDSSFLLNLPRTRPLGTSTRKVPSVIFITRESADLPGARIRCHQFARSVAPYGLNTRVLSFADTLGAASGALEHTMGWSRKVWLNAQAFRWLARAGEAALVLSRCNYHALGPALYQVRSKAPLILDLDDWEMREDPRTLWGWYPTSKAHWLTRWLARRSHACLAASETLFELLRPWNANVHYVPTAVDTDRFRPRKREWVPHSPVFAWIGTFHHPEYVDNLRWLLDRFAQVRRAVPQARLEIAGEGRHREAILAALRQQSAGVAWRGWIAPEAMPQYLETIDIGCYPVARSTLFHRAKSPTKLFEYMAMEKAVVASDVGEASRILRSGADGLLASSAGTFTDAMIALAGDAVLRRSLGKAARRTVEMRYSMKRIGPQLYGILAKAARFS